MTSIRMQTGSRQRRTIMKWLNLLERANYEESTDPTLETLMAIQQQCMLTIPFENLDIHLGRKIELDGPRIYKKVIKSNRGGFCYELNELLLQCLTELGFSCTRIEARVNFIDNPAPFDHQTCLIQLDELWLSDISFGDSSFVPLRLNYTEPQSDGTCWYRVKPTSNGMYEIFQSEDSSPDADTWKSLLTLNPTPQPWSAFNERCLYHQSSAESHFPRKRLCSRRTEKGRITLTGNTLKTRIGNITSDEPVSEADYTRVLAELFGVHLDKPDWINPLEGPAR